MRRFTICLSGQNKDIRKKFRKIFKDSDWNDYHLVESIDEQPYLIDHTIVENPNFDNPSILTELIETESMKFIQALSDILEE